MGIHLESKCLEILSSHEAVLGAPEGERRAVVERLGHEDRELAPLDERLDQRAAEAVEHAPRLGSRARRASTPSTRR